MSSFEFKGFSPNSGIKSLCRQRYGGLKGYVPMGSFMDCTLEKKGSNFIGRIVTKTTWGTFEAEAEGKDALHVVDAVYYKFITEITFWRRENHWGDDQDHDSGSNAA